MNIFSLKNTSASHIIESAFKMTGLYATGVGLSGEETSDAIDKLNKILNSYQNDYPLITNKDDLYLKINTKSSVIGDDGYIYDCIKAHKTTYTYPDDAIYSNGDITYYNNIIYEVTTTAPAGFTLSEDWPIDKNKYYTDGTYYFRPISNGNGYGYSNRPGSGVLGNIYFEKTDTYYNLIEIGDSVSLDDYFVVKPSDKNESYLFKATTPFNYLAEKTYGAWVGFGTVESDIANPYKPSLTLTSSDSITLPDDTFNIINVSSVNYNDNTTQCIYEIPLRMYLNKFNPGSTGTRPLYYATKYINNTLTLMLQPLINDDSENNVVMVERSIRFDNINSSTDTLNVPSSFIHLLEYELAHEIAILYGVDVTTLNYITSKLAIIKSDFDKAFKYDDSDFDVIGGY